MKLGEEVKGQLSVRGIIVGSIGCIIITMASAYTALKVGALPWPIVFAAIVSLFVLKAISGNKTNLNEVNVTHTIMSAGAMVAGGLAFTIPAAWMLGFADDVNYVRVALVALAGVVLGCAFCAVLRKKYIEEEELEFPVGQASAQTLIAGNSAGKMGAKLFGSMGVAGVYCALRDMFGALPTMLFSNVKIPGVSFGIYNSPMMLAVGFLVGTGTVIAWFISAILAHFGIVVGGSALGFWTAEAGQSIISNLGMGIMLGGGFAVLVKDVLFPIVRNIFKKNAADKNKSADGEQKRGFRSKLSAGSFACCIAAGFLLLAIVVKMNPLVCVVVVILTYVTCIMSSQSVGQTGIDPMEIFGLIVLLIVAAFSNYSEVQLLFIAAAVAVACGLAGDVMNDFKVGSVLKTSPSAQIIGQAIGAILGAIVATIVLYLLFNAYGASSFGADGTFVAAQASVVASMIGGTINVPVFIGGICFGFVAYLFKLPAMIIGLGVYLPFYFSLTAFLGALIGIVYRKIGAAKDKKNGVQDVEEKAKSREESGLVIASGLLGGESIIGVIVALLAVFM